MVHFMVLVHKELVHCEIKIAGSYKIRNIHIARETEKVIHPGTV